MPSLPISMHVSLFHMCSVVYSTSRCLRITPLPGFQYLQKMTLAAGLVITIALQQAYGRCESSYYRTGLGLVQTNNVLARRWILVCKTLLHSESLIQVLCSPHRCTPIHSRYHQLRFWQV